MASRGCSSAPGRRRSEAGFHRGLRSILVKLAVLLLLVGLAPGASDAASLLVAAESAPLTVVGRVGAVSRIDMHGYRAPLEIERSIAGSAAATTTMAWEELASGRAVRFHEGQQVLVVLEPLPTSSLWQKRFADVNGEGFVVAAQGTAFLAPPGRAAEMLQVYLALSPAARERAAGVRALAEMAQIDSALASQAIERLDTNADLAATADSASLAILAAIASDPKRTRRLRSAVIALAATHRLMAMKPTLERLAQPGAELEAQAWAALAQLDGGLAPEQAAALLERTQPEIRAVGVRFLRGPAVERELPRLVRADPSPLVRRAAAVALAETGTVWGLDGAIVALKDPDAEVRTAAAQAIALRGPEAIPALRAALKSTSGEAPGAIAALSLMGGPAGDVIADAAANHPDERIRTLAKLGLGKGPGHTH